MNFIMSNLIKSNTLYELFKRDKKLCHDCFERFDVFLDVLIANISLTVKKDIDRVLN